MQISGLNAVFQGQAVLKDFSIDLPEEGAVCFFGPSGCGKTTLLRAICAHMLSLGKKTAFLFQEDRLLPWKTAVENVTAVGASLEAAKELFARLGLSGAEGKLPRELSGGMQRRVALARALAYGGDVLFLDEPFTGLDEAAKAQAAALINQRKPPLTLLVTHDQAEAAALLSRVLLVEGPPLRVISP